MAKVIDLRDTDGGLVILGNYLTLPSDSEGIIPGIEPLVGSIRYNPGTDAVEVYLPNGNDWAWEKVGVSRGTSDFVMSSGGIMTGDLVMRGGDLQADNGTVDEPSITFETKPGTGLSVDEAGGMRFSAMGIHLATAHPTGFEFFEPIKTRSISAEVFSADRFHADEIAITSGRIDVLEADVVNSQRLSTSQIDVLPDDVALADPNLASQIILTTQGKTWTASHLPNNSLVLSFENTPRLTVYPDGTLEASRLAMERWYFGDEWYLEDGSSGLNFRFGGASRLSISGTGTAKADVFQASALQAATANISNWLHGKDASFTGRVETVRTKIGADWEISSNGSSLTFTHQGTNRQRFNADGSINAGVYYSTGADIAERYHADAVYEAGDVLVIGGRCEVTVTDQIANERVAGIVSRKAGLVMNDPVGTDDTHPPLALKGRVPCKVVGRVRRGDFLVTSNVPGHAMAATSPSPLAVIGIALEDFDGEQGFVEVMVK